MVTLALIGVGAWGQNFLKTAHSLKNCEIKYVYTQGKKTLNSLPDIYIKLSSIDDLAKIPKINGVIIATPGSTHFKIAQKFLQQGYNILIEKPMVTSYAQALKLQKIWQHKKQKVLVGHTYLYNPAFKECKKLLKKIGTVKTVTFEGIKSPVRKDVSVIWDWGPHGVALMLDLLKQPVKVVKAVGSQSRMKIELEFASNIKGLINLSWLGKNKVRKLTIQGVNQTIVFDDTKKDNQKLSLYSSNILAEHPEYSLRPALTNELEEFVKSIATNKKITSDLKFGVKVVEILSAIEESSIKKGKPVKVSGF